MDYVIYRQRWKDGRISYHRSPSDILEFARNQNPVPERDGLHTEERKADTLILDHLSGKLGAWNNG